MDEEGKMKNLWGGQPHQRGEQFWFNKQKRGRLESILITFYGL